MSQADALKALGNECFAKGKIDAAIDAYSEAICLDPRNPIYHTNRAMCYRKKEAWDQVLRDCSAAIAIDALSIKAHYFLGAALIEQGSYPDGIANLRRALDLCRDKTVSYKDDIRKTLLSARKRQDAAKWPSTSRQPRRRSRSYRSCCAITSSLKASRPPTRTLRGWSSLRRTASPA